MTTSHRPLVPAVDAETLIGLRRGVLVGAAVLVMVLPAQLPGDARLANRVGAGHSTHVWTRQAQHSVRADFGGSEVSADARRVAEWIARSGDHAGLPFVIVDKRHAAVHVFSPGARLEASTAVLIGGAVGDDSVPGIGSRPIADVLPEERTTPAGRFVAERGRNALGEDVVWVDYGAAVSMHRVRATNPAERRLERLATPSIDDNRVSYGCINVPAAFFDSRVLPLFQQRRANVYVLPDIKPVDEVFGLSAAVPRPGAV